MAEEEERRAREQQSRERLLPPTRTVPVATVLSYVTNDPITVGEEEDAGAAAGAGAGGAGGGAGAGGRHEASSEHFDQVDVAAVPRRETEVEAEKYEMAVTVRVAFGLAITG